MTQAKPLQGVSSLWIFHQTHCCCFCCKDRVLYSSLSHPISPQATWGFKLTEYSRFWILFLNCWDHLVGSSWMLCPPVAESAGLILYWEVIMGFNLAIAVKSLCKSSSLPLAAAFQLHERKKMWFKKKNKRGQKMSQEHPLSSKFCSLACHQERSTITAGLCVCL